VAETVFAPEERQRLRREAATVLARNDVGSWTTPSSGQYPHQWNWDTGFVALGWARLDWQRATTEIESLLRGQWLDGMVPHTVFDPAHLDSYFPGPDRWPNAGGRTRVPGVATSGISNPPVVASMAVEVGRLQPSSARRADFYARVYPGLADWLRWYVRDRTVDGCPLPVTVHPWESGWDNSPRWDFLRSAGLRPRRPFERTDRAHVSAEQRPTDAEYHAYLALIDLLGEADYSLARYREVSPFLIHDVLLDAVWYGAAMDVAEMAAVLGRPAPFDASQLREFAAAFEERHWSPELGAYVDYDLVTGRRRTDVVTPAGLAGLRPGLCSPERARSALERFLASGPGLIPLWSAPPSQPGFDAHRYWRGPVWAPVNWLAARNLGALGLRAESDQLVEVTLRLIAGGGFAEHYSPVDGTPAGAPSFSWSAAVTLDLLADGRRDRWDQDAPS
jgi:glucosylglycerate hydrolase